jgi:hypothetical protein
MFGMTHYGFIPVLPILSDPYHACDNPYYAGPYCPGPAFGTTIPYNIPCSANDTCPDPTLSAISAFFQGAYHDTVRSLPWVASHSFVQAETCFIVCAGITFQDDHLFWEINAVNIASIPKMLWKPSDFVGLNVGVNGATYQEVLNSDYKVGGGVAGDEGLGGGGGVLIDNHDPGSPYYYPYGYVTVGAGWEINAGPTADGEFF